MRRILILCRKENRQEYDQKENFEKVISDTSLNNRYVIDEYENILFEYDGKEARILLSDGTTDISSFDAVFLTGWYKTKMLEDVALATSLYLDRKEVKLLNTEALHTRSRSKLSQYMYAALNDISVTPFMFSMSSAVLARALDSKWSSGYPIIMKGVLASRGNDNYLVDNYEDANNIARTMNEAEGPWFVVQSFVPNDGDYRIIVMGERVTLAIHRKSQFGSHLNNTSKGGEAKLMNANDLPIDVVADSIKLAKLLKREVTGVDMIEDKISGKFFLLEINNMPQLVTGSYVAEKIRCLDEYLSDDSTRSES